MRIFFRCLKIPAVFELRCSAGEGWGVNSALPNLFAVFDGLLPGGEGDGEGNGVEKENEGKGRPSPINF